MDRIKIQTLHKSGREVTVDSSVVYSYRTHMHSYCEMTLYEPYDGWVNVNGKVFCIDTPTVVLVVPPDFHRIEVSAAKGAKFIKIGFSLNIFGENAAPDSSCVLQDIGRDDFLLSLFHEILETQKQQAYKELLIQAAVCTITQRGELVLPSLQARGSQLARHAVGRINAQFSENITLSSVAAELSVSAQYLSSVFKACIGINFSRYLNDVRLHQAAKLLLETSNSVTEICEFCGYRNFSHFLRSFKKEFGVSPTAYRNKE